MSQRIDTDFHRFAGKLKSYDQESQKCTLANYSLASLATENNCLFPRFEVFPFRFVIIRGDDEWPASGDEVAFLQLYKLCFSLIS